MTNENLNFHTLRLERKKTNTHSEVKTKLNHKNKIKLDQMYYNLFINDSWKQVLG